MEWLSRLQTYANASLATSSGQQCTCPTSSGSSTNAAKAIRQACCPACATLWSHTLLFHRESPSLHGMLRLPAQPAEAQGMYNAQELLS